MGSFQGVEMGQNTANNKILLEDETLRDGFQVENRIFSLEEKLKLFYQLESAGLQRIQVGSFVNPKRVPQMADTELLVKSIQKRGAKALLTALVLNDKGLERATQCGLKHVSMSISISDTHSKKNAGKTHLEAFETMSELIDQANKDDLTVRAGLQCSFGCVYEGKIEFLKVLKTAEAFAKSGASEINLADTSGMANPVSIDSLVKLVQKELPELSLSLHLHDTRGLGLANMFAGYLAGVRTFDACVGGLGGCPFVRGAAGNVSTEDAVHMFSAMGIEMNIDLSLLCDVVSDLEGMLGRELPGRMKTVITAENN
jgi:hydroxymethylglutaryl-CoA lyase